MKLTQKLKSVTLLPGNGTKEIKQIQGDLDEVLENARRLNNAAWDVVMETKDELYHVVTEAVQGSKGVQSAYKEMISAWQDLAKGSEKLKAQVLETTNGQSKGGKKTTKKSTKKSS